MSTNFLPVTPIYFESMHGDAYGSTTIDADHKHLSLTFLNAANDQIVDQITLHLPNEHLIDHTPGYRSPVTPFLHSFNKWAWRLMIFILLLVIFALVYQQSYYTSHLRVTSRIFRGAYRTIRERQGSPHVMTEISPLVGGTGESSGKQHIRYRSGSTMPIPASSSTMIPENV